MTKNRLNRVDGSRELGGATRQESKRNATTRCHHRHRFTRSCRRQEKHEDYMIPMDERDESMERDGRSGVEAGFVSATRPTITNLSGSMSGQKPQKEREKGDEDTMLMKAEGRRKRLTMMRSPYLDDLSGDSRSPALELAMEYRS